MLKNIAYRIPIKLFLIGYLLFLLVFSSLYLNSPGNILWGLLIVIFYSALDIAWTYYRKGVLYLPLSSFISALILALVTSTPSQKLFLAFFLALAAVFSKQILRFGGIRHFLNPAAFALAAVSFFSPIISWWGVSWPGALYLVLPFGLFILWRQRRLESAFAFFIVYAAGVRFNQVLLLDGTIWFFLSVMLIDPITSMVPTKTGRIIYGAVVALLGIFFTAYLKLNLDPLIFGLLAANLIKKLLYKS